MRERCRTSLRGPARPRDDRSFRRRPRRGHARARRGLWHRAHVPAPGGAGLDSDGHRRGRVRGHARARRGRAPGHLGRPGRPDGATATARSTGSWPGIHTPPHDLSDVFESSPGCSAPTARCSWPTSRAWATARSTGRTGTRSSCERSFITAPDVCAAFATAGFSVEVQLERQRAGPSGTSRPSCSRAAHETSVRRREPRQASERSSVTGGSADHGNVIHRSVSRHEYSGFTIERGFV